MITPNRIAARGLWPAVCFSAAVIRQLKPRIFCIDDEPSVGRLLKIALEQTGNYLVDSETDPFRAIQKAQTFKPDLFFLDIYMPGLDGFEVAKQIRQEPWLQFRPIIYFTGMDEIDFWKRVGDAPLTEFLKKGSSLNEIVGIVDRVIGARLDQFKAEESRRSRAWSR